MGDRYDNADVALTDIDTDVTAILADTITLSGGTLPAAPTSGSLATFISGGSTALGQPLPASMSLIDLLGNFTGAYDGAAQDDNIKSSLDLAHTDLDTIIADTSVIDVGAPRVITKTLTDWSAAAQDLFVVTNGPIRVLALVGTVLVAIKNVAMNLSIVAAATTPAGNTDIASLLDCDNDAAGTIYQLNATFGAVLVATTAGVVGNTGAACVMPIGTINMTSGAVEDGGGSIRWDMLYQRLSPTSAVAAA